jgi:hypothetical protein
VRARLSKKTGQVRHTLAANGSGGRLATVRQLVRATAAPRRLWPRAEAAEHCGPIAFSQAQMPPERDIVRLPVPKFGRIGPESCTPVLDRLHPGVE